MPIAQAPDLRVGLATQILDSDGKVVATNPISFVAPRVDDRTQTVLVKALLRTPRQRARAAVRQVRGSSGARRRVSRCR